MKKEAKYQIEITLDELMHKENNIKIFKEPHQIGIALSKLMTKILK